MIDEAHIWDHADKPPSEFVWLWRDSAPDDRQVSIPRHVEENAERIRNKYLQFIHDLGQRKVVGKTLVEHLTISDGLSFWWLTLLAEKSPLKCPRIYDCLRMLALEELINLRRPHRVRLSTSDVALTKSIRQLCTTLSIPFASAPVTSRRPLSVRSVHQWLPASAQALLSLRHLWRRWPLRGARPRRWHDGESAILLCSYFVHLDHDLCSRGEFQSRHWESLPKLLNELGRRTNWLHLFVPADHGPRESVAAEWARRFASKSETQGVHTFIESYLSIGVVVQALRLWLSIRRVSGKIGRPADLFVPTGSRVNLGALLHEDWRSSLAGRHALDVCVRIAQFDAFFREFPHHRLAFYLYESQPWEKIFLWAWRRHGHGKAIGVAHAAVPFWHLYYFDDARTIGSSEVNAMPQPDAVATNGPVAWAHFIRAGYPTERLIRVEALRYLALPEPSTVSNASTVSRVLVVCGIERSAMHRMLRLIERGCDRLEKRPTLTIKAHPSVSVDATEYPSLQADTTTASLSSILADYDLVLAHHSTSAALDAYQAGIKCGIVLDPESLNLSPLRGVEGVPFLITPQDVATALTIHNVGAPELKPFFWLDATLPRWRRLVECA